MRRAFRRDSWLAKTASVLFSVILAFGMTPVSAFAETPAARGGDSGSTQQVTAATESSATTSEQQTAQDSPATGQSSLGAQVDTTSVAETKAPDTTTANANAPGDLASLQAALASGATEVTLSGDIEISADATLDIPAGVTVKTAGHTFRVSAGALTVTGTGTIANDAASESSDAHNVFAVAEGASLVLGAQSVKTAGYDAILTYGSVTAVGTAIECTATAEQLTSYDTKALVSADGAAASFTMPSGSITMGTASAADCGLYGVGDTGGAKVVLGDEATHGGPTIGANSAAVGGNNLLGSMDLTIYGGTYTSQLAAEGNYQKFNAVLYLPADATVSISGGTFSGTDYAISMPYTKPDVSLSVSGGTFSGTVAAIWAGTEVGSEGANTSDSYNVTAGTFSSDPAAFLAAGVTAAQGADGTYSIAPAILTAALPGAQVGVAYSEKILTAGLASPSFYLSGGESLPEGLSLAGDGTISGTPAKAGTYAFDVVAGGSEGSVGPVQLTLTVSDTIAIATTSLDAALVNNAYTAQLASTTTASGVTWALAEGSVLPEGLSLGADGVISGTPTVKGATTFTVVATSSTGISASQELTLKVKDKYRQATGTVYLTISTDGGEWWVSDGEISGKTIAYVPIDLAEVSQFDLDEHGLGQFNYAARGDDGSPAENDDYFYECTMMQLFGYFAEHYYSGGCDASVFTGAPGSSFMVGYLGHDSNLNYYLNGAYPIDGAMSVGSPWMVGATSDHIALHDGDYVDMSMFQGDTESGWKYGATFLYFTTTDDVQTPIHDAGTKAAGESFSLKVRTPNQDMWNPSAQQTYSNFTEAKVEYGTTPGEALGEFPLDDEAVATISIDVPGTYYLWAKDTNDEGQYQALPAYATVTVTGDPCKPVITTTDLGYCTQGGSPSTKVQAVGSPNELTYLVQQDTLPDGLTMDKHGVISGTANEAGVFNVKVAVLNSAGITMAQIPLVVFGPIEFATQQADIPDAVVGQPYSLQIEAKGNPQSYVKLSDSYQSGNGLTYTNATVSGTPTSAGTFSFRAAAYYDPGNGERVSNTRQRYTVTIVDTPAITTESLSELHQTKSAVDIALEGTGGKLKWAVTSGSLPEGMTLDESTGHLKADSLETAGTYTFTVTATNAAGSASKDFTLTVDDNPVITTDSALPTAIVGQSYSTQLETQLWDDAVTDEAASGHTYSLANGSLPAGLALAADGTISGTPEAGAAGDYSFTVTYAAGSWSASKDFTLTVAEPLSITTESLPDAFRGQAY
ncbi:MAG: putative Ig domain-containing protein, partial [Coriobacteriales bacterium]|nr:putative Ig domain-containing protein [Coriobacteriales bacterium]